MKKFQIYSFICAIAFALFSCADGYLDTSSKTSLTEDEYYKTIDDAEMALVGCYDGYQRTVSDGGLSFYATSEVLSDNCFGGTGNSDGRNYQVLDRFDPSESSSDNDLFNTTWRSYYTAIARCNKLLNKLDDISWGDSTAIRPRIEGEARFLRAVMYFDLARLFERIPLLTTTTMDNIAQSEATETYQQIVSDLKFAADSIPASAYPKSKASTNDGRATCYAAKALLARVYLFYTGYYGSSDLGVTKAEVLQGLEDIIDSGEYSLVSDFASLWPASSYVPDESDNTLDTSPYAGEGNSETIFAQKFNNTQDYNGNVDGNLFIVMLGMRNTNWSPYGKGWGACTVNPDLFNDYSDSDARKAASIIDIAGEGVEDYDTGDQREYTGYMIKKYSPTCLPDGTSNTGGEGDFQISQDQDYVIVRYADVLLMAAELGSTNAQDYYDQVRERAGLTTKTVSQANIMEERRLEFAFEGIRYWDLLRQGLAVAASAIAGTTTLLSGDVDDKVTILSSNIVTTRGFMQIPQTQITLSNNVLTQNEGW
ncbi:MAG: RagB/SusD domain protein [Bacteroidetes bacterium]|jgi:starch-binding outer membrane protein, SusD/RagB family|nr:RagB/SusD domain protein [Bacteroidota bacterium]